MSLQTIQVRICDTAGCGKQAAGQCVLCNADVCAVHGHGVAAAVMSGEHGKVRGRAEKLLCPTCLAALADPGEAVISTKLAAGLKALLQAL